jgi:hypothetical protein
MKVGQGLSRESHGGDPESTDRPAPSKAIRTNAA